MEFDKSKVYTALNAEEVKDGSKVALADTLKDLKEDVRDECFGILESIRGEEQSERFVREGGIAFALCYLVSEPQIDWIVYLHRRNPEHPYLTACRSDVWKQVQEDNGAKYKLYCGTEKECQDWYTARKHHTNIIAQWEDGKEIQMYIENGYVSNRKGWVDVANPSFYPDEEYRVKPESLEWTDLKVGDILKNKLTNETRMVTAIIPLAGSVCLANYYSNDLDEWEKV